MEHLELYQRLRAAVVGRHFAYNNEFRINLFKEDTALVSVSTLADYIELSGPDKRRARWTAVNVGTGIPENPWNTSAPFVSALAIEESLGHARARSILTAYVDCMSHMFRFEGEFSGYPIRWDPIASEGERWRRDMIGNRLYSAEFRIDPAGRYDFSNQPSDFRAHPLRTNATLDGLMTVPQKNAYLEKEAGDHRYHALWEPSQDEVFGMVYGLYAIQKLTLSADLRDKARELLHKLANYLADHAYMLVKPHGGVVGRGAGESLVGAEYALSRAFLTALGEPFGARTDWAGAMDRAGFWKMLEGPIRAGAILGAISAAILPLSVPSAGILQPLTDLVVYGTNPGVGLTPAIAQATRDPALRIKIGKALAVLAHDDCFDPYWEGYRDEHAITLLLHEYDPEFRFRMYMEFLGFPKADSGAVGFAPYIAMFGLDDPDPLVHDAYLHWSTLRFQPLGAYPRGYPAGRPLFTQAMTCLVDGSGAGEVALVAALDCARQALGAGFVPHVKPGDPPPSYYEDDLALYEATDNDQSDGKPVVREGISLAIDYVGALALAWLHARRRLDAGGALSPGFPTPPHNFTGWLVPAVPIAVAKAARTAIISHRGQGAPLPWRTFQLTDGWSKGSADVDLFPDAAPPPRSPEPTPVLPPRPDPTVLPAVDRTFTILATQKGDLETGIVIDYGDVFEFTASGAISPAQFWGTNGPGGVGGPSLDARWALHAGIDGKTGRFGLLARLNGYFAVPDGSSQHRWLHDASKDRGNASRELFFRINDDVADGSGAFVVRVRRWGAPRLRFDDLEALGFAWIFPPSLRFAVRATEACGATRVTVRVSHDNGPKYVVIGDTLGVTQPGPDLLTGPISGSPVVLDPASRSSVFWTGLTRGGPNYAGQNGRYVFYLEAISARGYLSGEVSIGTDIEWHGQQISCIRRPRPSEPHRIRAVGGIVDGRKWTLSADAAIHEIAHGQQFFVDRPTGDRVEVVVAVSAAGRKYLKTVADGDAPNNLLMLPDCKV